MYMIAEEGSDCEGDDNHDREMGVSLLWTRTEKDNAPANKRTSRLMSFSKTSYTSTALPT